MLKTFRRAAVMAGLAGALSLAAVTSSSAAHWGGWGPGPAIGAGVAGLVLGAAAAAAASPYYGYYDYDAGPVVAPGPYYDAPPYYATPLRRRFTGRRLTGLGGAAAIAISRSAAADSVADHRPSLARSGVVAAAFAVDGD